MGEKISLINESSFKIQLSNVKFQVKLQLELQVKIQVLGEIQVKIQGEISGGTSGEMRGGQPHLCPCCFELGGNCQNGHEWAWTKIGKYEQK